MSNHAPTPEPSEVAETTAGERRLPNVCRACGDCYHPSFGPNTDGEACDWCRDCGCPSAEHPAEPDAGEVEALTTALMDAVVVPGPFRIARGQSMVLTSSEARAAATRILASPWLAAHVSAAETKARADERERIARAIEAEDANDAYGNACIAHAALIARGDAR